MDDITVERVLLAVEQIPPGRVAAYGDIAALLGIGARQVGRIMHDWGSDVAWWRVTNRDGDLPTGLLPRALPHWDAEAIGLKPNGRGCRIAAYRADLIALADDYEHALRTTRDKHRT